MSEPQVAAEVPFVRGRQIEAIEQLQLLLRRWGLAAVVMLLTEAITAEVQERNLRWDDRRVASTDALQSAAFSLTRWVKSWRHRLP